MSLSLLALPSLSLVEANDLKRGRVNMRLEMRVRVRVRGGPREADLDRGELVERAPP